MWSWLARARVPLGFASGAAALLLASPTWTSWIAGSLVAAVGETLRIWAAGHIDKGREITQSGPYRYVRHPLYLGSALIGVGFAVASHSVVVMLLAAAYLALTIAAAIRTEEAALDRKFAGAYSQYRAGAAEAQAARAGVRRFSWARARKNREYRALSGCVLAFGYLAVRAVFG